MAYFRPIYFYHHIHRFKLMRKTNYHKYDCISGSVDIVADKAYVIALGNEAFLSSNESKTIYDKLIS
jgi:hypothetical protein